MTNYVVVFSITLVYKIFFLVFFLNVFNTPIQFCMPLQSWFSSSNPFTTLLSCFTIASGIRSQCLRGLLSPTQSLLKNLLSAYCLHNAVLATGLCICLPSCQPPLEDPTAPSISPVFSSPTHPSRLSSGDISLWPLDLYCFRSLYLPYHLFLKFYHSSISHTQICYYEIVSFNLNCSEGNTPI